MATRLYLPDSGPTLGFTPTFDALWGLTSGASRVSMVAAPQGNALATSAIAETSTTNPLNILHRQYISAPLQAQTITGTLSLAIKSSTSNTASGMRPQLVARVIAPNGTVRGTLYAGSTTFGQLYSTGLRVNSAVAVTVTSVAALAGDRIVVEVGTLAANTVTTSYTSNISFGDPTGTDSAFAQGATTGTPWMEFSATLSFNTEAHASAQLAEVLATASGVQGRIAAANIEVLGDPLPVQAAVSRQAIEVLGQRSPVEGAVSRQVIEVLGDPTNVQAAVTRQAVEVLGQRKPVEAAVSKVGMQVLGVRKNVEAALSGVYLEVLGHPGEPPPVGLQFVDRVPLKIKFPDTGFEIVVPLSMH